MSFGSINFRYKVLGMIGKSNMSRVYKVWDSSCNSIVALKASLRYGERYSEEILAREFVILSKYCHPRIVRALHLDFASEGSVLLPGTLFFTMEYMRGKTLDMARNLSSAKVEEVLSQILAAMKVIHNAGIVYGDIKPHNIMMLEDARVKIKLFDFGLAMKEGEWVNGKEVSGTLLYIAPEMLRAGRIDRRSDLYSLGALLYEMMTGVPPFRGKDAVSVAYGHLMEMPVNPSSLNPSIPEKYRFIISKLMQKDPRERFQSAEEVISFLNGYRCERRGDKSFKIFERMEKGKPEEDVFKERRKPSPSASPLPAKEKPMVYS